MTSFAFCGLADVQLSSNGPCICPILSFSISPNNVIQKSSSDAYIYTLILTISHAGYAICKTPVLHDLHICWPQKWKCPPAWIFFAQTPDQRWLCLAMTSRADLYASKCCRRAYILCVVFITPVDMHGYLIEIMDRIFCANSIDWLTTLVDINLTNVLWD